MSAFIVAEVPNHNDAATVAGDELALVWVNDNVVDGVVVGIRALDKARAGIPDADGVVFRGCDHPFALAVEGYAGNVAVVSFKCHDRIRVGGLDVVEPDDMATCGGKEFLVGRNAQAVDL